MLTGTLGGIKRLKRTVEVVRQTCHSMWRQWCLEFHRRCPAMRGCVFISHRGHQYVGGGINVRYPPLIILLVVFWYTTLLTRQLLHLYSSPVTAPSHNVRADPTEITVCFHSCDSSGIVAY
jgi:hypothetical protein